MRWLHTYAPDIHCSPLQGDYARQMLPADLTTPTLQGVVLVDEKGKTHVGHLAIQALSPHVARPWRWVLRWAPAWGYRLIARTRTWWGRDESCDVR